LNDEGLTEAVIWLASQMKEQYKLEVAVHTNGVHAAFEDDVRVLVFQSIRELLFNVVKHSGILMAQVGFEQIGDKVFITVSDGGMGFDSQAVLEDWKTGHGLLRMRDRLLLLGCNLEVKSEPDNGTSITIEAPIKDMVD
jgi:two-component system, chemotaxis family, CheB/CheR fusion protein